MAKVKIQEKSQISFFFNPAKQMVPCENTAKDISFEWSHHRISYTDSKVRTTIHVSMIDSGSERVKQISNYSLSLQERTKFPNFSVSTEPLHL